MDITFNPPYADEERRRRIYDGELVILSPTPDSLALVSHTRCLIEEAFAPLDPRQAHHTLAVEDTVARLIKLKPYYIHHPETRELLRRVLLGHGCDAEGTYQDVPRMRCAFPADYLTTGIAYAHHPHRDTWYSAPMCQLNWWMPIYDFDASQGMAFHPRYWGTALANGSRNFNYYHWNAEGRKNAAQHIGKDTRVQPHPEEPIELEPEIRCVVPAGGILIFSAAQLHSSVRNLTSGTRWSIDFRTVHRDDLEGHRGAANCDSHPTGTSIRDFRRMRDFTPMPDEIVALYDDGGPQDGVAVYRPAETVTETPQMREVDRAEAVVS